MTAPVIHGMGRIMFGRFEMAEVELSQVRQIPGGPAMDEEFIKEGARLLDKYPTFDFPYIIVWHDFLNNCYWVIDGRHRLESYKLHGSIRLHVLVGRDMLVLPQDEGR